MFLECEIVSGYLENNIWNYKLICIMNEEDNDNYLEI